MISALLRHFNFGQKARLALVACFCSAFSIGTAYADTIDTFSASGTFQDGAALVGTVVVDITTGTATSSALTVTSPDSLAFNFVQFQQSNVSGIWELTFGTSASGLPNLNIGIATSGSANPMIGYTGGTLASFTNPVQGSVSDIYYSSTNQVSLITGSFSLAGGAATPEPASLALLAFGGASLALFGAARRRSHRRD